MSQSTVITNKTSAPALFSKDKQKPLFIQFHALVSYPPSLLNRDDTGLAKRIVLGDTTRVRVSSQCLKRHWTEHKGNFSLEDVNAPDTIRSRVTFELEVIQPILAQGFDEKNTREVVEFLCDMTLGKSEKAKKEKAKAEEKKEEKAKKKKVEEGAEVSAQNQEKEFEPLETKQVVVLGRPEILYISKIAMEILENAKNLGGLDKAIKEFKEKQSKDFANNLRSIPMGAGLTAAMMGRMATGDALSRYDAAVSVAHAFTVHAAQTEADYFSAIDNLESTDRGVSGHLNSTELTAGVYYIYWCIDLRQLVSNLTGSPLNAWERMDRSLAADIIQRMIFLSSTVSVGAKKGSTAPYNYASMVMLQVGDYQPMQISDAFLKSVQVAPGKDLIESAQDAIAEHLSSVDSMYGFPSFRAISSVKPTNMKIPRGSLGETSAWVKDCVIRGMVTEFGEEKNG